MRFIFARYRYLIPALAAAFLLTIHPSSAFSQSGGPVTKGSFVERFFLNKFSRPPSARAYVPADVENLSPAERYAAVVRRLNEKGVILLTGSKPEDPLTRVEHITLTYLLAGGVPGKSFAAMKDFLKERGAIDASDIGFIKAFQGDSTVTREGAENPLKITGAESVQFLDLDETDFDARLELQFDDGSTITIGEDTALTIDEMVFDPKTNLRNISLRLTVGTLRVSAAKNTNPNSAFNVITPTSIAGVRGTEFNVLVAENGATRIITFEGAVGVRALLPSEARPESRAEARPGAKPGVKTGDPSAPAEEPAEEVVVEAGQTTAMEAGATAVGPVETATQQQIQEANTATAITEPATVASVSAAETSQTGLIVQVEITESTTTVVESTEEIAQLTEERPIEDDKGEAGGEVDGREGLDPDPGLGSKTGSSLKSAFLALSATEQANQFGTLTFTQQKDLLSLLTQAEVEAVLAVFKPSSPFTAAVLDSLLDFGAAASAKQVGQFLDNLTVAQVVELANCDGTLRRCVSDFTTGVSPSDKLTAFGKDVDLGMELELARLARSLGGTITFTESGVTDTVQMILATAEFDDIQDVFGSTLEPWFVSEEILLTFDRQVPDIVTASNTTIQDAFGGAIRPAVYSVNGGYQAGQLRSAATGEQGESSALIDVSLRVSALNNDGFLAYAVQVEEDIVNAGVLAIRSLANGTFASGNLDNSTTSLIDAQLNFSSIRDRDALLAQQTDARAGVVLINSLGDRVRVQQYVYRPSQDEVRVNSVSLIEELGINYLDIRAEFTSGGLAGKSAIDIRNLPWNNYFTVLYDSADCTSVGCTSLIGSPSSSPSLENLRMEIGNQNGDFIREEMLGFGSKVSGETQFDYAGSSVSDSTFVHQHPTSLALVVRKAGAGIKSFTVSDASNYDPRAGSSGTFGTGFGGPIPTGEFRSVPDTFGPFTTNSGDPKGFSYVGNDGGTLRFYPIQFSVLGDATTSANAGRQTSTCGSGGATSCDTLKIETIWDAFRVNQPDSGQTLSNTINIGANSLQIKAASSGGGNQVLSANILNAMIPWPRMIWGGESNF